MSTLRERCSAILKQITKDAILRQGSSVETLVAFVQSEMGRKAEPKFEQCPSLILYFHTDKEREDFIEMTRQFNPTWMSRKLP